MSLFDMIATLDAKAAVEILKKNPDQALVDDENGFTPLMKLALVKPDSEALKAKFKADPKIYEKIVDAILEKHDLDVLAAADYLAGRTALHWACEVDNIDFYRALYKHTGSQTWWYARDFGGKTPVALARENQYESLIMEMEIGRSQRVKRGANSLTIIGMGPAGTALFVRLVKRLGWTGDRYGAEFLKNMEFNLYDKGALGLGTPYDPGRTTNTSLLNVAAGGMSIDADNPMDFVAWIKELELKGELAEKLGAASKLGLCPASARVDGYYPRTFYGKYLSQRLEQFIAKAKKLGIKVNQHPDAEVVSVDDAGEKGYVIKSVDKEKVEYSRLTGFVYYTTGHFVQKANPDAPAYTKAKAYIETPINSENLRLRGVMPPKSKGATNVAILGSSLSAVDLIYSILLHPEVGSLSWSGSNPTYKYKDASNIVKVACFSRKGLFSKVRPSSNRDIDLKYLNPSNMAPYQRAIHDKGAHKLEVNYLIEVLEKELVSHLSELKLQSDNSKGLIDKLANPYENWDEMNCDPFKYLEGDIEWADNGQDVAGNVRWYQVMHSLFPIVRSVYRAFSAEERKKFAPYGSLFLWAFAPMPLRSAKVILAMHKAGALDLFRINERKEIQFKNDKFQVNYFDNNKSKTEKAAAYDFLCSTVGLHSVFHLDESKLTENSKASSDSFGADADFVFFDPYTYQADAASLSKKPAQEKSAWIADDGTFEIAMFKDKKLVHTPARRGVGYFLQDQIFDVQAVPSVVKYSSQVAELYYDEFVHRAGKSLVTGGDLVSPAPKK